MPHHIYKTPTGMMVFFVCFGSFLAVAGLAIISAPIWSPIAGFTPKSGILGFVFTSILGCVGCGLGACMIIATVTSQVDLYPDAIVVRNALPFGNRRIEKSDIAAKLTMFVYVPMYVLYPRAKDQKKLTIGMMGSEDDYYREWMAAIPEASKEFLRNRRHG